ncbi:hypothetical protein ABGI61_01215 [Rheinheimera sp. FR7-31]|uniref:hypothetical protein n=1 Tax=Rheinheimera fenheensis TaxID=3152295 RepID=UPI00325EB642
MRKLTKLCYLVAMFMATASTVQASEKNHLWNNAGLTYANSDTQQTYLLHGKYELGYRTYAYAGIGYGKIDDYGNSYYDFNFEPLYSVRAGLGHYYELATNFFVYGEFIYYRDKGSYTLTTKPDAPVLCLQDVISDCSIEINLDENAFFTNLGSSWQFTDKLDVGLEYIRVDGQNSETSNRISPSIRYRISDDVAVQVAHVKINGSSNSVNRFSLLWTF